MHGERIGARATRVQRLLRVVTGRDGVALLRRRETVGASIAFVDGE